MGDFNNTIILKYKDIPNKYNLSNLIEKPTRNSSTLLDHIITNIVEKVSAMILYLTHLLVTMMPRLLPSIRKQHVTNQDTNL